MLDALIEFKDPAVEVTRYLGVYHQFGKQADGTITLRTESKAYLTAAVKRYMEEIGVKDLAYALRPALTTGLTMRLPFPANLPRMRPRI